MTFMVLPRDLGYSKTYFIYEERGYKISDFKNQEEDELFLLDSYEDFKPLDSLNSKRLNTVLISEASLITGGLLALNQLWYSDFEQSNFRTINDSGEWRQLDKFGHVYATYQLSRLSADAFKWSGLSKERSNLYGSISSYTFMTAIEFRLITH